MFAFAVLDRQERTLTCVRDAFGIKPLFYAHRARSSTHLRDTRTSGFVAGPAQAKELIQRSYEYLVFGRYDDAGDTFFDGVRQLPPGHRLTVDLAGPGALRIERWWWPSIRERTDLD